MRLITHCPICGAEPQRKWSALVAPFIADYALEGAAPPCSLLECGACGLRFFDARFEADELQRLYGSYRGEAYFTARHRHEFWYTRVHNEDRGHAPAVVADRKSRLASFLRGNAEIIAICRVLDYGGDSGQFMPDDIGQTREVFEVSNAEPVPGVRKITMESDLEPGAYDLILLCHVLEHLPEPKAMLESLKRLLRPKGGLLYVEVPSERYSLALAPNSRSFLDWLCRHPFLMNAIDFWGTACRVKAGFLPPLGFPKLHEHINLFDQVSLRRACEAVGLKVVAVETHGSRRAGTLRLLAEMN